MGIPAKYIVLHRPAIPGAIQAATVLQSIYRQKLDCGALDPGKTQSTGTSRACFISHPTGNDVLAGKVQEKSEITLAGELAHLKSLECAPATYEEWLKAVFSHPVSDTPWYWDGYFSEPDHTKCIQYLTSLFSNPEVLDEYLDEQVCDGLYFLISSGASNHLFAIFDENIPLNERVGCITSMSSLFTNIMAKRCSHHLSHLDEPNANPLNQVCYMWWDILPLIGHPGKPEFAKLDQAALTVMEECLALPSVACQESALHGLGHWNMYFPSEVQSIIDSFLKKDENLRPELLQYAKSARSGCVN